MRGHHHFLQGTILAFIFFFVIVLTIGKGETYLESILIVIPLFIFLGSIYPDTDERNSEIFRLNSRNWFLLIISIFYAIIAYPLRWLIFWPTYYLTKKCLPLKYKQNIQVTHRNFNHSFFGIFMAAMVLFIVLSVINYLFEKDHFTLALIQITSLLTLTIVIGFFIGGFLHLLQDVYSMGGLFVLFPFSNLKISGDYSSRDYTDKMDRRITILLFVFLIFCQPIFAYIITHSPSNSLAIRTVWLVAVSAILIIYLSFGIKYRVIISNWENKVVNLRKFFISAIVILVLLNILNYILFIEL